MDTTGKKRYTIGILQGNIQTDCSEALTKGFYTCAREEEVNLIHLVGPQAPYYCSNILSVSNNEYYSYQFDSIYDYAQFSGLDALIIEYGSLSLSTRSGNVEQFLSHYQNVPSLILADIPETNVPYQIIDNYGGLRSCMEHLLDFHHYKKIAFIAGPPTNRDSNERLAAYRDMMASHHLTVTEDMVIYGDYSENIDDKVEYVLARNPGLEAIVFANDDMAKAGYRVCGRHNLLVGRDIAITGFDDVDFAQTITPPLTSITHNGFQFGYTAMKKAILLCSGGTLSSKRPPATLRPRCSCGCQPRTASSRLPGAGLERFIADSAAEIAEDVLTMIPHGAALKAFSERIKRFFSQVYQSAYINKTKVIRDDGLFPLLDTLLEHPNISNELILERFTGLLHTLQANAEDEITQEILSNIISSLHQYIHPRDVVRQTEQKIDSNQKAWFVPTFIRDLMNDELDLENTIIQLMDRLALMKIKSAYLYLFENPVHLEAGETLSFNEKLSLAAFYNQSQRCCYESAERPVLTGKTGFSSFLSENQSQCLTAFVLFSGTEQYGILLCDVVQEDISFVQLCCLQIGTLFSFLELHDHEKKIQKELHESLKVIQEQNHVLSFISEYDELTKLLNRRGFMEHAIALCQEHRGQTGYLIFGDLDHLKEINDCFGHAAGDLAICTAARFLSDNLPPDALTARIGGDEYVALVISEEKDFSSCFSKKLKATEDKFNDTSGQPFYVELSVGIESFPCNTKTDLNTIIQRSDAILYQSKKLRRASIKKPIP